MSSKQTSMADFTVLNKLGSGAFSDVFKVYRKSDQKEYALKKVRLAKLSQKEKDNSINEVRILASINHPNICSYKEAFVEESTQSLCIVMEFADGGDLQTKINQLKKTGKFMKEADLWSIFFQMVLGLHELHGIKIAHRDIKAANVFLSKNGTVKLGDLNVSKVAKTAIMHTQTGTPYYASPEVWQDKPYDKMSDIWSLGAVLYEMVALSPPFTARDMKGLYNKVIKGVYPKIPSQFSSDMSSMIASLLQVDPKKRPGCEQILQMPVFIAKYNENRPDEGEENLMEANALLGTIRVPRNLSLLTDRLPKANYETEKKQSNMDEIQEEESNYVRQVGTASKQDAMPQRLRPEKYNYGKPPLQSIKKPHESQRNLIDYQNKQSHTDLLIHNQLAARSKAIIASNKSNKPDSRMQRIQSGARLPPSRQGNMNAEYAESSYEQQNPKPQLPDRVSYSRQSSQNQDIIKVRPYQKKYLNDLPGSCPVETRRGPDQLAYEQRYGKEPLLDRAERLQKLQRLQRNDAERQAAERLIQSRGQKVRESINPRPVDLNYEDPANYVNQRGVMRHQSHEPSSQLGLNEKRAQLYMDGGQIPSLAPRPNLPKIASRGELGTPYQIQQANLAAARSREYQRVGGYLMPPSGSEQQHMIPRTRSKDSMPTLQNNLHNNRYGSAASSVVEAGRLESQRLLMERYRRIEVSEQNLLKNMNGENRVRHYNGMGRVPDISHIVTANGNNQNRGNPRDSDGTSRHHIPMSSKGSRPIKYAGQQGDNTRMVTPSQAMRIMYNQPSQMNIQAQGGNSRPVWWG